MSNEREQALFAATDGGDRGAGSAIIATEPALAGALAAAATTIDIFDAAAAGRVPEVSRCLDAAPDAATSFSGDGFTALHLAAFVNRPDVAALLIAHGADVDAVARNAMKVRPLHSAATVRAGAVVGALLAHGADPNAIQERGITALMSAVASGDAESVRALLAHGADVSARDDDGKSACDHPRERNRPDVVVLLEAAARRWEPRGARGRLCPARRGVCTRGARCVGALNHPHNGQ